MRAKRERDRALGLIQVTVTVPREHAEKITELAAVLEARARTDAIRNRLEQQGQHSFIALIDDLTATSDHPAETAPPVTSDRTKKGAATVTSDRSKKRSDRAATRVEGGRKGRARGAAKETDPNPPATPG